MITLISPEEGPVSLRDLHIFLANVPLAFRDRLCHNCHWSIPTFYRKMHIAENVTEKVNGRMPAALSNAEKEMAVVVMDEIIEQAMEYVKRFRRDP